MKSEAEEILIKKPVYIINSLVLYAELLTLPVV